MTSVTYSMRVYIMFMLCLVCVLYILIWLFENVVEGWLWFTWYFQGKVLLLQWVNVFGWCIIYIGMD